MNRPEFILINDKGGTAWINVARISSVLFTSGSTAIVHVGDQKYVADQSDDLDKIMDLLTKHEWGCSVE